MKTHLLLPALLLLLLQASVLPAANWPQFRGPEGTATSDDKNVPLRWSDTENLKWKLDLPGAGSSSPIVWGNRVFVVCFSGADAGRLVRHIVCVDKNSGRQLWQKDYPSTGREDPYQGFITEHGYASHTPVTDGERVIVHLGKGGVVALDFEGKELWRAETGSGSNRMRWGSAGSPVLWNNLVVINAADEAQSLMAFDKATGKPAWKQTADLLNLSFGTPHLLKRKEGVEELLFAAPDELWAMNPENGKLRWYAQTGVNGNVSPDAVIADDVVCVFGGYPNTARVAVKLGTKGEVSPSDIVWRDNKSTYIPTPIHLEGRLYCVSDQGLAFCIDVKTGNELYRERVSSGGPSSGGTGRPGSGAPGGQGGRRGGGGGKGFYASPVLVNGSLIAVSRRQGAFVYPAKPQFETPTVNVIPGDNTDFNATPAVSDGSLFLRSNKALYCVGHP